VGSDSQPPPQLALVGYEHEWPADFEAFVARELVGRDGARIARVADLSEATAYLSANPVDALIVNARLLTLRGKVSLRECHRLSPSTAVVAVAVTAAHGLKDALEGGATAFVSWPAPAEVIRRAVQSASATARSRVGDGADGAEKHR
jgi:DNA-binding NtrC family response regulator